MDNTNRPKDAEDILSEFDSRRRPEGTEPQPEPQAAPEPEPQPGSQPHSQPQAAPEPQPDSQPQATPEPDRQPEPSEPARAEAQQGGPQRKGPPKKEARNIIYVGTKPLMTYVSETLTQLSTYPTVTIKARGKKITPAVDVSQMIVKRMNSVGYEISGVRISSDSLMSEDGKARNVSTMEIDITKT